MVKVLGISASPKKYGNTEKLLDSFLKGAKEAGGETEKVTLKNLHYRSCQACNTCHKTGVCVLKDDFAPLYEKIMNDVDILVLASPIYSMTITAEMKSFIDRGQFLWARRFVKKDLTFDMEHLMSHKGIFISTSGQDLDDVFDAAFPVVRALFNGAGFDYCKNVTAQGMDKYGGIDSCPEALREAEEAGKLAVLGHCGDYPQN